MKQVNGSADDERFRDGAEKYAAYLETPEGRLRLDLTFATLDECLPLASLRALDVGGGTGAMAVRLAQRGLHVTLLDSSVPMLDLAKRAARDAGIAEKVALQHGDATQLMGLFPAGSFDLVLCHNILEYVDDPGTLLRSAAGLLRRPSGTLSVVVRNQAGEVLKAAIREGDLDGAEHNLTAEWAHESLYGGRVRLFTAEGLRAMLVEAGLAIAVERGVRVVSDYLPPQICGTVEYERIFELERKLGRRREFAAIARYLHWLARCTG